MPASECNLGFVRDAFDLMERLDKVESETEIRDGLTGLLAGCGIDFFTVTPLRQPWERLGPHMLLTVWPRGWLAHYDRKGYYRIDPIVRQCFQTREPFAWSMAPPDPDLQVQAMRLMGEAAEHGMGDGFCVPVHDVNGFQAVVSLAGRHVEVSAHQRRALHLVSYYAYGAASRVCRLRRPAKAVPLSQRERDVLSWLALGKRAGEVGDILGVSETTVATHLARAKSKLGTTNTTHTVVEALRQRQIRL